MMKYMTRLICLAGLTTILAAPANGQSTSKYSTVENRPECKIWNPNPQPNETVYWTGKCVNGYGEGKGIVSWGNVVNGRAQISVSDVTLKRGKQEGHGNYYSRNGSATKRQYIDGKVGLSDRLTPDFVTGSSEGDTFAAKFPGGLISAVQLSDLKAIVDYLGYEQDIATTVENQPVVSSKDTEKGNRIMIFGTACNSYAANCKGIMLGSGLKSDRSLSFSEINNFNTRYNMAKLVRIDDKPNAFNMTHYIILNNGIRPDNLKLAITNFSGLIDIAENEFSARDSIQE